jgi:hypothetical protein
MKMVKCIYEFSKNRPRTFWSMVGIIVGAIAGLFIGGVGIAVRGGATGIPAGYMVALVALAGSFVGYRVGVRLSNRG